MSDGLANVGVPNAPAGEFFQWVRNTLVKLQDAILPPGIPSNVRATALAGAIQIDFTRSDGDSYSVLWNTTASINHATMIDIGTANKYVDDIGAGSVTRYYAVRAQKGPVLGSISAWVTTTSLALGTPITPPDPPPATETPFTDDETGSIAVQVPNKGYFEPQ